MSQFPCQIPIQLHISSKVYAFDSVWSEECALAVGSAATARIYSSQTMLLMHCGEYRTIAPNIKEPTDFMQQFPNLISEFKVHGIKRPDHLNELPQTLKAVHSVVVDSTASSFVTSSSTTYSLSTSCFSSYFNCIWRCLLGQVFDRRQLRALKLDITLRTVITNLC
jgi:hypothetical protein